MSRIAAVILSALSWCGFASAQDEPNVRSRAVQEVRSMGRLGASLVVLAIVSCALSLARADDQHSGSVSGTVIDESGQPVRNASVYAHPMDRGMIGIVPNSQTDEAGQFTIKALDWGLWLVSAAKEDGEYPNLNNQFYSGLTKPLELGRHYPPGIFAVRLTSGRPTAAVHLRLGPKAGVLFGTVTDAKSGFPLNPCAELKRANTRNSYINGTGLLKAHYRLLIPSNTDINLKVWLTGYKLWYFPGTSEAAANKALRMSPAQEIRLDIQLEPDATATGNRDCGMPVGKTEP